MIAVVLRGTGGVWHVLDTTGETREVSLRGRLKKGERGDESLKLAVGDEVSLERDERDGVWAICEILPRRSKLARRSPGSAHGERVVAANLDQVAIVFAAAEPEPHLRMLDRFLVIAAANDIPSMVIVNKVDLVGVEDARDRFADYERAGYSLHTTSAKKQVGLEGVRDALSGRVSALSGPSGVGKSSLINAIYPGLNLRVGEISRSVMKGRHITVGAEMHPLPGGGFVMDTPGLRELGLWGLTADDLEHCFLEFLPMLGHCKFGDCRHTQEPGCAVRDAVDAGRVSAARYQSYLGLSAELIASEKTW